MKNLTKHELMEIILSVHAVYTDFGTEKSEHDQAVGEIYEEFIQRYDYEDHQKEREAINKDTEQLLSKLIDMLEAHK